MTESRRRAERLSMAAQRVGVVNQLKGFTGIPEEILEIAQSRCTRVARPSAFKFSTGRKLSNNALRFCFPKKTHKDQSTLHPLSLQLRSRPIAALLFLLLSSASWQIQAATRIENDRYKVDIEAGEGTYTIAVKPSGKTILSAGKLSGRSPLKAARRQAPIG